MGTPGYLNHLIGRTLTLSPSLTLPLALTLTLTLTLTLIPGQATAQVRAQSREVRGLG